MQTVSRRQAGPTSLLTFTPPEIALSLLFSSASTVRKNLKTAEPTLPSPPLLHPSAPSPSQSIRLADVGRRRLPPLVVGRDGQAPRGGGGGERRRGGEGGAGQQAGRARRRHQRRRRGRWKGREGRRRLQEGLVRTGWLRRLGTPLCLSVVLILRMDRMRFFCIGFGSGNY